MGLRIVFFGTYILSDAYPVNQVLYAGVSRAAGQVWSCRVDLWDGFLHRALHAGWGRWFRLALRACGCYAKLIWRYMRCPEHEVVVVGYPGYIDILLARLLNLFSKRTLVLVSFISLYDTAVMDRQSVSPGSLKGRLLYAIDRCAFRSADWVLVDTQELGSHYANLFNITRDKFRKSMVGNIFDRFPTASRESVPSPSFRVLFFGTYVPLHGVECPPRLPLHKVNEGSVRKRAEPLSREDRLRIVALNPLDLELYRHAVTVHKERVEEVVGPCRIRTNCTSVRDRDLNLIWGEGALRSCGRMVYRSGRAGCRA